MNLDNIKHNIELVLGDELLKQFSVAVTHDIQGIGIHVYERVQPILYFETAFPEFFNEFQDRYTPLYIRWIVEQDVFHISKYFVMYEDIDIAFFHALRYELMRGWIYSFAEHKRFYNRTQIIYKDIYHESFPEYLKRKVKRFYAKTRSRINRFMDKFVYRRKNTQ